MADWFLQNGVPFSKKSLGCDRTYQLWVTDPDGYKIELQEYTPQSAQLTGIDIQVNW